MLFRDQCFHATPLKHSLLSCCRWDGRSTPMAPDVAGIWGKYKDANDVNAVCTFANHGRSLFSLLPFLSCICFFLT